jgi:hypothetical protein
MLIIIAVYYESPIEIAGGDLPDTIQKVGGAGLILCRGDSQEGQCHEHLQSREAHLIFL